MTVQPCPWPQGDGSIIRKQEKDSSEVDKVMKRVLSVEEREKMGRREKGFNLPSKILKAYYFFSFPSSLIGKFTVHYIQVKRRNIWRAIRCPEGILLHYCNQHSSSVGITKLNCRQNSIP